MKTLILLFTEDPLLARAVANIAQKSEWEGAATDTIRQAAAFLSDREWDVVIADIGRHGRGFQIFDALETGNGETPIIILSEQDADMFQALALANGASEILAKPLDPRELHEAVTRLSQHGFRA